jgi:hypothetical protein
MNNGIAARLAALEADIGVREDPAERAAVIDDLAGIVNGIAARYMASGMPEAEADKVAMEVLLAEVAARS